MNLAVSQICRSFCTRSSRLLASTTGRISLPCQLLENACAKSPYLSQPRLPTFHSAALLHTSTTRFAFDEVEKADQFCINYEELKDAVENDNVLIVDVRRPDEVEAGKIPAKRFVHIPVQEVADAFQMSNSAFKDKYGIDMPSKDADDIVFHCRLGGRSTGALRIAQNLGFLKTRHFPGGWEEWSKKEP